MSVPGPKFAVLTATHEGALDHLPFCIESVQAQAAYEPESYTYRHVIVNDGSERTKEYLDAEAERDPHIVAIHLEENRGQVAALKAGELVLLNESRDALNNHGISVAETLPNYFIVVDADDGLTPKALFDYTQAAREQYQATGTIPGVMFGQAIIIDEHGQELDDVPHIPGYKEIPDTADLDSFLRQMKVCNHLPSKPAFHWEFFQLGAIPNTINGERVVCADWLLALSGLKMCRVKQYPVNGYVHMPTATSYYRVHPAQSSLLDIASGAWEHERAELVEKEFDPFAPESKGLAEEYQTLGLMPSRAALQQILSIRARRLS